LFSEVDESLRSLLTADVPLDPGDVDITFDRPTREWSSRLSRPTLNLFLADVRERTELRDQTLQVRPSPGGEADVKRKARRIDLTYCMTAWTADAGDEHRILAAVLACMFRNGEISSEHLRGGLAGADFPVAMRIMPPDFHIAPADLWSVLDNELHTSLTWVATAPLDAFAPSSVPLVRTTEISYAARGEDWRERYLHVAGVVRREGADGEAVAGATVRILGTAFGAVTDDQGRFDFPGVRAATYTWQVTSDGEARELSLSVPADSYEIRV